MAKEETKDLIQFLKPFPENVMEITLWLREFIWDFYPQSNELIYDNYNALAIGFSLTDKAGDVFCSIAVCSDHVNFGFNRGVDFPDRKKILLGNGSQYRFIRVKDKSDFPEEYIKELLAMAYENSTGRMKPVKKAIRGETIVKSISPVKRRPV